MRAERTGRGLAEEAKVKLQQGAGVREDDCGSVSPLLAQENTAESPITGKATQMHAVKMFG